MGTLYRNGKNYGSSINVPTKISELENDSNFQTDSQVSESINNSISPIQSDMESLQSSLPQEISNRESGDSTLDNKINTEISNRENQYSDLNNKIDTEISNRESGDSTLDNKINTETNSRIQNVENLQNQIDTLEQSSLPQEISNRESGDSTLDNKIDTETNTRIQNVENLHNQIDTLEQSSSSSQQDIKNIQKLIPSQATENNQLADKDFVNSSISSNTANFINTFNSIKERDTYTTQHSSEFTPNDYCFVTTPTEENVLYIRYKWVYDDISSIYTWKEEYQLNNSGFTAKQWSTINSGITSTDKTNWNNKQDKLVSGTNIKTVNGSSILGSGNIKIQSELVSGTNIKTVNGNSILGSGNIEIQSGSDRLKIDGSNGTSAGVSTLINKLTTGTSDPIDNDYYVAQYAGGGTTTTTYHRRPIVKLWNYIKSKMRLSSGDKDNETHDCNLALTNGFYYYTSNGPSTSIGASATDGSLYVQRYNDTWISQIAQDYRNGNLFVRSKNNGTWTSWVKITKYGDNPMKIGDCVLQYNSTTKSLDFIFN